MANFAGSLDANVLLRLLLNDVPKQHAAAIKLMEISTDQFAVADTAIIEVVFVLERHYQFSRPQIKEAIDGLASLPSLNCNRELLSGALPLYARHQKLSFEDCCLAVYAELNNALPLWTFDIKLAHQARGAKLVGSRV